MTGAPRLSPPSTAPAPQAPPSPHPDRLVQLIAERIGRKLAQRSLIERDMDSAWLTTDGEGGPLDDLIGHSISYRIAVGPRAGQKLFTLQALPQGAMPEAGQQGDSRGAVQAGGFSLHAGVDIEPHQRSKLERLCRYVSRPPVSVDRMALTPSGQVRYTLKSPYRDGTTHIVLEPLDLMARLAALVPHSKLRAAVTPAGRGSGRKPQPEPAAFTDKPPTPRHLAMNWAKRLKRVFGIDIEACARCGGKLKVIASIEDPTVIAKILSHLECATAQQVQCESPLGARAPPAQSTGPRRGGLPVRQPAVDQAELRPRHGADHRRVRDPDGPDVAALAARTERHVPRPLSPAAPRVSCRRSRRSPDNVGRRAAAPRCRWHRTPRTQPTCYCRPAAGRRTRGRSTDRPIPARAAARSGF